MQYAVCPNCDEELSFLRWHADDNSNVICPMCDYKFKMIFEKHR